jgi:hypothetical protein
LFSKLKDILGLKVSPLGEGTTLISFIGLDRQDPAKTYATSLPYSHILFLQGSVANLGCLSRIPDPEFYPSRKPESRIPDPTTAAKEEGENFFVLPFFLATNFIN